MICFCWVQLPQYAARCIGALAPCVTNERVIVVATRPKVPVRGMERFIPDINWIDEDEPRTLQEICGEIPRVLFVPGWGIPVFNRFRDEVRMRGCKVLAMSDNNYIFSAKECFKALRFRLIFRSKYDGYLVPGKSGQRLMHFYGVDEGVVASGLYAADSELFHDGEPLAHRPKRMIFVGRLEATKNVIRLCEAFRRSSGLADGWCLDIYGCGSLRSGLKDGDGITIHDFMQPEQIAVKYRESRVFILPSIKEHWGLVVHEAALSGCVLLLSDRVGAKDDMLGMDNGFEFDPYSVDSMVVAMDKAFSMSAKELAIAQEMSKDMARNAGLDKFVGSVKRLAGL